MFIFDPKDVITETIGYYGNYVGNIDKNKLPASSFHKLVPGDYILISFRHRGKPHYSEDNMTRIYWENGYHSGSLFVKIVSVKMPKPTGFFAQSNGQVAVELPDGRKKAC